ncbi:exocyst complex component 3 [Hibiscus syriacus]|uniref:Exocyst complex component 3 n=1 Tax=Hibiscus syriacus TaxID=106335 RepID=A0A6A3AWZ9_HIBSY|nr:exocyst complex component 3 [Hibiscus syriacus]
MELHTVKDAFDGICKNQAINDPVSPVDLKSILSELKLKLNAVAPLNRLGLKKERNINLSKYPKLLEKSFNPDISKAYRNVDFDFHTVNQIVANHFYQQGLFDPGDSLIDEAGEPEAIAIRSHFLEMYQVLESLKVKDLEPALNWIVSHLAPFASLHMNEFQKLVVCIIWVGKLDSCPHAELMAPTHWEAFTKEIKKQFCSLAGQSYRSPLNVAVAAGVEGLPALLKLVSVIAAKRQEWQEMKQLTVPMELEKELQFHSIFACPVSRDQDSKENPPMLMPCLHVLCKQAIMKLSESEPRTFRCPYCPTEVSAEQCRQLYF